MQQTTNYQLNQWDAEDRILRADFNSDNAKTDAALAAIRNIVPQIAVGSYMGTGTKGSDNPNTLTFDFPPKLVIVAIDNTNSLEAGTLFIRGQTKSPGVGSFTSSGSFLDLTISWDGNSLSWYTSASSAADQMNIGGSTYCYFAIG